MFWVIDTPEKRRAAADCVARLSSSPTMAVEIKPYRRSRSVEQNRLYWMWLHAIADYTGHDDEELHLIFREALLGYEPIEIRGERVHTLKSTTELTVRQFTEYLNRVARAACHLNIVLPYPETADFALGTK